MQVNEAIAPSCPLQLDVACTVSFDCRQRNSQRLPERKLPQTTVSFSVHSAFSDGPRWLLKLAKVNFHLPHILSAHLSFAFVHRA